ncbi:hypothetical protein RHMOL_Rhmol02G0211800 [Rhododendron molle]|uniref:Uncharacterized protein n=1 Tax=Rhododendron molle TaxID=49168 RepID=A0ACC0PTV5_RHOML|nr:hypothetical protein RHMOL_Rhmol02G0211800 [Rhododendron molle]
MEEPDMACCRFDGNMPEYDPKGDLFTVKVHHGGALCYSPNVSYLRGDVPDRDLNYGLIELKQDEDILGMVKWVYDTNRIIDVYVVERPEMVLTVYKPQRVVREESLRNEKPFEEVYQISEQDYDSGSESSELEEFKDSDYDFSEDDRLFDVNVDRNVEWVGLMKGKRKEMTSEHEHNTAGDEMNSDELICLDGSSSSDEDSRPKENTRFYEFNSKADMVDPQFKTHTPSFAPPILSHGGITINEPSVAPSAVTTTGTIPITAKGKEKIGGVRGGKRGGGRARGRARGIIINEPSAGPSAVTAELGAGSSGKGNEKTGGGRGRGRDGCRGGGRGRGRAKGRGGKAMISNMPLLPMWDYSNFNIPSQESVHGPNVIAGLGDKPMIVVNNKGEEKQFAAEEDLNASVQSDIKQFVSLH